MAFLEEELKRFKNLQNGTISFLRIWAFLEDCLLDDDDQAIKRRKDALNTARQERLKLSGDRTSDDEMLPTQSMKINDDDDDDDDDDDFDRRSTQKRTQTSTRARGGRGRGRPRATATPRGKRKPF